MPSTVSSSDRPDPHSTRRDRAVLSTAPLEIYVCQHKTCRKDGSAEVLRAFEAQRPVDVSVVPTGCMGNCGNGPMVSVWPDQVSYSHVRSRDVAAIVAQHSPTEGAQGRDRGAIPQAAPRPERRNGDDNCQPPSRTGVGPYVALGLALLIALGSILGTALLMG